MEPSVPAWALVERLGDDELVVVDCRGSEEARRIPLMIPGALRMSLQELQDAAHTLPDDELIVLCDGDGGFVARRAWRVLQLAGRSAAVLDGGLHKWLTDGYPTENIRTRRPIARRHDITVEVSVSEGH